MSYDPEKDLGAGTRFLGNILYKTIGLVQHMDTQISILLGTSSAIFLFSLSRAVVDKESSISKYFYILIFFSLLSSIVCLLSVHPPRWLRKRNQKESLLYNKTISEFYSPDEFESKLLGIMGKQDLLTKEYSKEIYNLAKYYYRPKRKLFNLARNILFLGFFTVFLVFVSEIFSQ